MDNPNTDTLAALRKLAFLGSLSTCLIGVFASVAHARPSGIKLGTTDISLDSYCDVVTLTVFAWHQAGMSHTNCDGDFGLGSGMEGNVTGIKPKDLTLGEQLDEDSDHSYLWNIQYPLKSGNTWSVYTTTDGFNYTYVRSGTYTISEASRAAATDRRPSLRNSVITALERDADTRPSSGIAAGSNPDSSRSSGTTYINLDGWCDVLAIHVFPWNQAGEYDPACGNEYSSVGSGMEGKDTGVSPKDLTIGESRGGAWSYLFNIQYPLVTGQTWSLYKTSDGINYSYVFNGTYTVVGADAARAEQPGMSVRTLSK